MRILLILAHPDPSSLNHAIASEIRSALTDAGHTIWYHDLYDEKFDPVLPSHEIPREAELDQVLSRHCRELTEGHADLSVRNNDKETPLEVARNQRNQTIIRETEWLRD